jgi:ABC-type branched-subunit amino acid transport system ATPase component/branched-subunit amino acid ABC-type transport system permease component
MNDLFPFIVSGIVSGVVYGLAGSGLVLTYRTSGIFNLGHGAIAAAAAYIFYWLTVDESLPWGWAMLISVPVLGSVLGLVIERGARSIGQRETSMQVVAGVGVIVIVEGVANLKFGSDPLFIKQYLPGGSSVFRVGGVNIGYDQLTVAIVAIVVLGLMLALLRGSRIGLLTRAVVDNPELSEMHGTNATRVRQVSWMFGSSLAALSGVLLAPFVGIQAITLTYLVVAAIGAAAIGRFTSIPWTYAGGVIIGVCAAISQKYVISISWLAGLPDSIPFLVLLATLLILPVRKVVGRTVATGRQQAYEPLLLRGYLIGGVIVVGLLLTVPLYAGAKITLYMQGVTVALMFLSLGLLVRLAGQVSLCQAGFAAIAAVGFSQFSVNLHLPWLLALLLGGLLTIPFAATVALIAVRLSGLFLALASLAFGILMERFAYQQSWGFGNTGAGRLMPRPSFATGDKPFYFLLVLILVIVGLAVVGIDRARLGRMLRGLAGSPTAVSTMGLSIPVTKVVVFCISAFIAGLSGMLYGQTVTIASYGDSNFASFNSLSLLAVLAIAPLSTPWFAIFAVPVIVVPGYIGGDAVGNWLHVAFGVFAIMIAVQGGTAPLPAPARRLIDRVVGRRRAPDATRSVRPGKQAPKQVVNSHTKVLSDGWAHRPHTPAAGAGLQLRDLTVRFGGLTAVNGVSLEAPPGRITGLIGPNGAGKTTLFDAASGLVRLDGGRVLLGGADLTTSPPPARARRGLGRTFQVTELCNALSVRENVALGREAGMAGRGVARQFVASRSQRRSIDEAVDEALALCGIEDLAGTVAARLSTGERRLVEVARCLAGDFTVLLMDELSAGLDAGESAALSEVLRTVIQSRGCGILLVEHDMQFVMSVCDYLYVVDFGQLLFEGTPAEVAQSPVVQAAYLGSTDDANGDAGEDTTAVRELGETVIGPGA